MASNTSSSYLTSLDIFMYRMCLNYTAAVHGLNAFNTVNVTLMFPLSTFVLGLGLRQWWHQRSLAVLSPSNLYTYNMAVMELVGAVGSALSIYCVVMQIYDVSLFYLMIATFPWYAQMLFPILVCVEHYLAVVHPITYLRLKQGGGAYFRCGSTAAIWLLCFFGFCVVWLMKIYPAFNVLIVLQMALSAIIVAFIGVSILCVLIRPRPGEVGGGRARLDPTRSRALQTVLIIMSVLGLRFGINLITHLLSISFYGNNSLQCGLRTLSVWFNLPGSLLLPLLYLHRTRRLPCCKHNLT